MLWLIMYWRGGYKGFCPQLFGVKAFSPESIVVQSHAPYLVHGMAKFILNKL